MDLRCVRCNKLLMTAEKVNDTEPIVIQSVGAEGATLTGNKEYCHIETKCPRCKCMNTFGI